VDGAYSMDEKLIRASTVEIISRWILSGNRLRKLWIVGKNQMRLQICWSFPVTEKELIYLMEKEASVLLARRSRL